MSTPGIEAQLFVAYLEDKPVGGAFVMWYDGYYENTWFSTLRQYNHLYTSYLLHWEMINHATHMDAKVYSMGRSTIGSGVHRYKSQWPAVEKEVYFNHSTAPSFQLKDQKWISAIWRRIPGFVADRLGPSVAERIY